MLKQYLELARRPFFFVSVFVPVLFETAMVFSAAFVVLGNYGKFEALGALASIYLIMMVLLNPFLIGRSATWQRIGRFYVLISGVSFMAAAHFWKTDYGVAFLVLAAGFGLSGRDFLMSRTMNLIRSKSEELGLKGGNGISALLFGQVGAVALCVPLLGVLGDHSVTALFEVLAIGCFAVAILTNAPALQHMFYVQDVNQSAEEGGEVKGLSKDLVKLLMLPFFANMVFFVGRRFVIPVALIHFSEIGGFGGSELTLLGLASGFIALVSGMTRFVKFDARSYVSMMFYGFASCMALWVSIALLALGFEQSPEGYVFALMAMAFGISIILMEFLAKFWSMGFYECLRLRSGIDPMVYTRNLRYHIFLNATGSTLGFGFVALFMLIGAAQIGFVCLGATAFVYGFLTNRPAHFSGDIEQEGALEAGSAS